MTSDAAIGKAAHAACTCGCGKRTNADYWHAWQAGRARGWSEGINRPLWWLRLTFWLHEGVGRLGAQR